MRTRFWEKEVEFVAEAGIILIILSTFPFFGWLSFFFLGFIFSFAGLTMIVGFLCVLTTIGLILLISDRKGFVRRMKGNKMVVAFLIVFGLLLAVQGFLSFLFTHGYWWIGSPPDHKPTSEELAMSTLYQIWTGLAFISGLLWFFFGLMAREYKETGFLSSKQEIDLFMKYAKLYPNPTSVLEFHISQKIKEGRTREQAIEELIKESETEATTYT